MLNLPETYVTFEELRDVAMQRAEDKNKSEGFRMYWSFFNYWAKQVINEAVDNWTLASSVNYGYLALSLAVFMEEEGVSLLDKIFYAKQIGAIDAYKAANYVNGMLGRLKRSLDQIGYAGGK